MVNTAVISKPGVYVYSLLIVEQARQWLDSGPFQSRVRYTATAEAMAHVLGVKPRIDARAVWMMPGDEALVFRISASVSNSDRISYTREFVEQHHEIGCLRRIK